MSYLSGPAKAILEAARAKKKKEDPTAKYIPKERQPGMGGKTYFLKQGNLYKATSEAAMDLHDRLPAGNYVAKFHPESGFYLERVESFRIPEVVYGDTRKTADRILRTYDLREGSTGVLLCGRMGSGKSLLAKLISHEAEKRNIPTILVNQPFCGDNFNTFISTITQDCIVFFDEFEKVYDEEAQQHLLTLFDGVFGNKKLFITTANNRWKIDSHMMNRPGRFYYFLEFGGLNYEFIREYCQRNLDNAQYTEQVCVVATLFEEFNFDMLQALVEEVNRYDEAPRESIKFLNTKPSMTAIGTYTVTLTMDGVEKKDKYLHSKEWNGNPVNGQVTLYYKNSPATPEDLAANPDWEDMDEKWLTANFYPNEIVHMDVRLGVFEFVQGTNKLTLKKVTSRDFDYEKQLAF